MKEAYPTAAKENNGTIVRVTDDAGKTNDYPILNYDLDADGNFDSNATLQEKGFLCLEIDRETFGKPAKIDFYDKDGRLFRSFETRLNCDEEFFRDAVLFADEYNSGMDAVKFRQADENFRAKNENYLIGSVDEYRPKSIAVSCVIVVLNSFWVRDHERKVKAGLRVPRGGLKLDVEETAESSGEES